MKQSDTTVIYDWILKALSKPGAKDNFLNVIKMINK